MVTDTDSETGSSSSSNDDKAEAAFSLVKYENPEVIDQEDPHDGVPGHGHWSPALTPAICLNWIASGYR